MNQIEPNLLKYIWMNSRRDQLWMLVVILASMPFYFLSLDLPKQIVNGPIQGRGFENPDDTAFFLTTYLPIPEWLLSPPIKIFDGFELDRIAYLFALSGAFLVLVAVNGGFKRYINTYKGRMGERMLRLLRYQLFDRVLRYPLPRFRRTKASEIASMIKDEVEPMGNFIGDAFTQPLFLGGQAITGLTFIFLQNVPLGFITLVIVVFQAWLIPRLRRRLIVLNKQQQIEARQMAGRLGEVVESIQEVHTNDTTNYERANIAKTLNSLYFLRFEIFQRKFYIKYLNNMLIQFLAFLFYAAGGYLAIRGSLDIGQLVAVIAAYKDLPDPIRGLIDYDQQRLTVDVRYKQIVEQFAADDLQDPSQQRIADEPVAPLKKGFDIVNLQVIDETGSKLIEKATTQIDIGEQVCVVGAVNSGATHFTEIVARLLRHSSGRIELNGHPIEQLPEYITGRRLGYVDASTYFPQNTIFDTLTYVLKNQPVTAHDRSEEEQAQYQIELAETRRAGNTELDIEADWIDRERLGVKSDEGLIEEIHKVLVDLDFADDVRALGLRGTLDPARHPLLCEALVKARHRFRSRLTELGLDGIVEPFEPERYNNQATIGENLLFGTAVEPAYNPAHFPSNIMVRSVLAETGLEERLFEMGKEVAATTVELFGDLSADNPFFDQLDYMDAEEIPEYRAALNRIGHLRLEEISDIDQKLILKLPFAYVETRNRLGLLDDELKSTIVEARRKLRDTLEQLATPPVSFFDPDRYNAAASVMDNVLLGRISSTVAEAPERVTNAIRKLLAEMELTDDIFRIGLEFNIGTGGKRLSETQRQKLHLARTLLKRPDFLIVNQALNALDGRLQRQIIEAVLARSKGRDGERFGVIWSPMSVGISELFDRVLVFENGVLVADGKPSQLARESGAYSELIRA
ncbi:MAG: ABC transporter ATP-binding protein/permease [Salaquimonas sp.]|nr:ABC transporter ATP-binding protein/permease [Salaquimonas sp.]